MNDLTTMKSTSAAPVTTAGGKGLMGEMLRNPALFEHVCRMAKVYANSPLFPEHLRKGGNDTAIANAILVMNIASRLNEDELTVAQNIYFVGGKPGWSASYMISKANQHGVFRNPIDWEITGKGDTLSITAFGNLKSTNKRVEITMTMETAKKEGWTSNKKYQSIPEVMLRYRSATALIRLYCPEVMIGIPSEVEIETNNDTGMRDVTPQGEAATAALEAITGGNEPDPALVTQPEPVKAKPAARSRVKDEADDVTDDAPEEDAAPKKVNRTPPAPAKVEKPEPEVEPIPVKDDVQEAAGISAGDDERPEPDADVPLKIKNMAAAIFKDIEASGSPDAVAEFYADQIEEIRKAAPAIYATLDAAFKAANAA